MAVNLGTLGAGRVIEIILINCLAFLLYILIHLFDPFWYGVIRTIENFGDICS